MSYNWLVYTIPRVLCVLDTCNIYYKYLCLDFQRVESNYVYVERLIVYSNYRKHIHAFFHSESLVHWSTCINLLPLICMCHMNASTCTVCPLGPMAVWVRGGKPDTHHSLTHYIELGFPVVCTFMYSCLSWTQKTMKCMKYISC